MCPKFIAEGGLIIVGAFAATAAENEDDAAAVADDGIHSHVPFDVPCAGNVRPFMIYPSFFTTIKISITHYSIHSSPLQFPVSLRLMVARYFGNT